MARNAKLSHGRHTLARSLIHVVILERQGQGSSDSCSSSNSITKYHQGDLHHSLSLFTGKDF